jgi:hypothetical protein
MHELRMREKRSIYFCVVIVTVTIYVLYLYPPNAASVLSVTKHLSIIDYMAGIWYMQHTYMYTDTTRPDAKNFFFSNFEKIF